MWIKQMQLLSKTYNLCNVRVFAKNYNIMWHISNKWWFCKTITLMTECKDKKIINHKIS